jgi:hypothetical protein
MLDQAAEMYIDALECNVGKNVPPLTFDKICATFGNPSWMNRHSIFYHYKCYKKHNSIINDRNNNPPSEIITTNTEISDLTEDSSSCRKKGGRPSLLQTDSIDEWRRKIESAKILASQKYQEAKEKSINLAKGGIDKIVIESLKAVDLPIDNAKYI